MNTIKNRWVKNIKVQKKVNNQLTFLVSVKSFGGERLES